MNPITKLVNIFRKSKDKPKASNTAVYSESGWVAEVEVVKDDSDAKQYRYTLRVIKTLKDGYIGRLHDEHIFNVFAIKQYAANCGWRLSTADF